MKPALRAAVGLLCAFTSVQAAIVTTNPVAVFTSGGAQINVDVFKTTTPGLRPTIIYLYGSDGMALFPLSYKSMGSFFASQGFNFYIVHYFDRTGTVYADTLTTYRNYGSWLQTITDATKWASTQPGVDPQKIGLFGLSLGAGLAVMDAAKDPLVKAVVEWCGGEPKWYEYQTNNYITYMPPTLILQGGKHSPGVTAARELETLLKQLGTPYQMNIYPDSGHGFYGRDQEDAMQRTLTFFRTFLGT